jgi:hypothetical protein
MPVEPNATLLEASDDAVIWRFMDLRKFRDLMASEELYFRRADLFSDSSEGLPPDQYALRVFGLDPYDIKDRASLNHHMGSLAQHRECYYISCWHLFRRKKGHAGGRSSTLLRVIVSSIGRMPQRTKIPWQKRQFLY